MIFYGTAQPIDSNDPVSISINAPQSTPSNAGETINYSAAIKSKQSNIKGINRKQQKQQEQLQKGSLPPRTNNNTSIVFYPRKNTKILKNNKTTKQEKQTTPHPYTIPRNMSVYRTAKIANTSTKRPLAILASNNNYKRPSMNILDGSNSRINSNIDKIVGHAQSSVEAPKQIVMKLATSNPSTWPPTAVFSVQTLNEIQSSHKEGQINIPNIFQKYEKIQQIYPEFHPYLIQQPKSLLFNHGKPSRDGSRNHFFPDDSTTGQLDMIVAGGRIGFDDGLSVAFAGTSQKSTYREHQQHPGPMTMKKNTVLGARGSSIKNIGDGDSQDRTQDSAFVLSSTKIGKG